MLLEISGEITPDRMKEWNQSKKTKQNKTKQKNPKYPVVDVTGDRSKVRYCKEEYIKKSWQEYTEELYKNIFLTKIIRML